MSRAPIINKLTVQSAADYVRTSKASSALTSVLSLIRRVFTFTQERSNRLARYIQITRAYRGGQAVKGIEDKYGCSRGTILRYARMADLPKRPKHLPKDIRAAVIADYKRDNPVLPVVTIAELHDVSPAYVSKIAREEGISRYAPRPKRKRRS